MLQKLTRLCFIVLTVALVGGGGFFGYREYIASQDENKILTFNSAQNAGTTVTADMLVRVKHYGTKPTGVINSAGDVAGKVLTHAVVAGDPIYDYQLRNANAIDEIEQLDEKEYTSVLVKISDPNTATILKVGDRAYLYVEMPSNSRIENEYTIVLPTVLAIESFIQDDAGTRTGAYVKVKNEYFSDIMYLNSHSTQTLLIKTLKTVGESFASTTEDAIMDKYLTGTGVQTPNSSFAVDLGEE